ncbi:ABC transporter substrate-binding protein [Nguyenibacter sp. L1]|uniref:ABC transporter substrate-binding protein n=1 Tax=Nguyenibacter sp. L1 TaxID=3049350 RepID=UPI002B4AA380|nr:ABC transporter substrate-binding protein [Nguyenibacter sp. L1]WRH88536.1 ABC transporter substrate-binding protein [Nguyenibacter sp. L1]
MGRFISAVRAGLPAAIMVAAGCAAWPDAAPARSVVDMTGRVVACPDHPSRIADLWFAHNELVLMLGGAGRIAVTDDLPSARPWMYRVAPVLHGAAGVTGAVPNVEMLLGRGVDLVFAANDSPAAAPLRRAGLAVVQAGFTDTASLLRALDLTADVLGDARAHDVARRYRAMLDATMARVEAGLADLPPGRRLRVLHVKSLVPLTVDGGGTIIDEWIGRAGGRNVAAAISGNMRPVSLEQVAAWDPDVVILGPDSGDLARVSAQWGALRAVRDGRVYRNPSGVFPWDRYGSELPLQVLWAAKTLYPGRFARVDMVFETIRFYREFFGYDLTPGEAVRILAARPPAGDAE